ncbi:MAG: hypothetical protein KME20_01310 [Kaiparowitsia implicata GSE-PSE-MK54-09C]|jgi:hypothetical protein|nr:hypothetical protein [Kaiparowitsia implicata GSE-PSE-MK54-09C]
MGIEGLPFEGGNRETERFSRFNLHLSQLQGRLSQLRAIKLAFFLGEYVIHHGNLGAIVRSDLLNQRLIQALQA